MDLHKTKLNRAFELLAKIRDFISKNLLGPDVQMVAKTNTRIQKHNNHMN